MSTTLSSDERKKIENDLAEIESNIEALRKKKIELNSKLAETDVNDYVLKDRNGRDVKLSEMFGSSKHLILIHNMGKDCSYCTMWADGFKDTYKEIEKKAPFVLVCPDKHEVHKEFAESRDWKFNSYSAYDSEFVYDMGYEERKDGKKYYLPGVSVFEKNSDGRIRRVSKDVFGPGDFYCNIWHFIDLLPVSSGS